MIIKFLERLFKQIEKISEENYSQPGIFSLEGLLCIIAHVYSGLVQLRMKLYKNGIIRKRSLPCKIISVGNVTAGGTGKTPMAIYLAKLLENMGWHPVVISRGYRGNLKKRAALVGNGNSVFLDVLSVGDESYMMAALHNISVVVGKKRYHAACLAIKKLRADVIIMDDGFQQLELKKNIDLLLLDHDRPFGNFRILPAGRLREPLKTAGQRAHALIMTRCPYRRNSNENYNNGERAAYLMGIKDRPIFRTFHKPFLRCWIFWGTDKKGKINQGIEGLKGKKAVLFSGICHNKEFKNTVTSLNCEVLDHLEFLDHHQYTINDVAEISRTAEKMKAQILVTTEKDWSKLALNWNQWMNNIGMNGQILCTMAIIGIKIEVEDELDFRKFIQENL